MKTPRGIGAIGAGLAPENVLAVGAEEVTKMVGAEGGQDQQKQLKPIDNGK